MTSRRQTVHEAIRQAVRTDPQLSTRAISRELRAQGYKFSNARVAALTRVERLVAERFDAEILPNVTGLISDEVADTLRREQPLARYNETLRTYLREVAPEFERSVNVDAMKFRIVRFDWTASATMRLFIGGSFIEEDRITRSGYNTGDIEGLTIERVSDLIARQLQGRFLEERASRGDFGDQFEGSRIDGVRVDVRDLQVTINRIQARG